MEIASMTYLLATEARDLGLVPASKALRRARAEARIENATVYVRDELTDAVAYAVEPDGSVRKG
jgi:hypothetical protein